MICSGQQRLLGRKNFREDVSICSAASLGAKKGLRRKNPGLVYRQPGLFVRERRGITAAESGRPAGDPETGHQRAATRIRAFRPSPERVFSHKTFAQAHAFTDQRSISQCARRLRLFSRPHSGKPGRHGLPLPASSFGALRDSVFRHFHTDYRIRDGPDRKNKCFGRPDQARLRQTSDPKRSPSAT